MELKTQIAPLYSMVLVELYETNPYEAHETETGLKLTNGQFDNPDTGNRDMKELNMYCGKIIETGPDCKYAKPGDDCFLPLNAVRPVYFKGRIYFIIAEQNLTVLMADDLDTRFKK